MWMLATNHAGEGGGNFVNDSLDAPCEDGILAPEACNIVLSMEGSFTDQSANILALAASPWWA